MTSKCSALDWTRIAHRIQSYNCMYCTCFQQMILNQNIFYHQVNLYTNKVIRDGIHADLRQLSNWFKVNKLSLNIGKTNYILFSCKNNKTMDEENLLQIDNVNIHRVNTTKFLGIHIDSTLQWHEHINHVKKKISSGLYALNTSKYVLQQIHMKTLYYSLIHPYLNYGCLLWGNMHKTFMHKLEVLQRQAIRTITNQIITLPHLLYSKRQISLNYVTYTKHK